MSEIHFKKEHSFGKEKAREIIQEYADKYGEQLKKFKIEFQWDGDTINLSGPAKGTIEVREENVEVSVKLGLAARMLKGRIEEGMKSGIEKVMKDYA